MRLSMDIRARASRWRKGRTARRKWSAGSSTPSGDRLRHEVLVGRNVTRRAYNMRLRERRGLAGALPIAGDKLVCLRNNRRKACSTAAVGGEGAAEAQAEAERHRILQMRLKRDEDSATISMTSSRRECARNTSTAARRSSAGSSASRSTSSTTAMCSHVHKSQGSRVDDVVLFDESERFARSRPLALYRGERAAERLCVVVP